MEARVWVVHHDSSWEEGCDVGGECKLMPGLYHLFWFLLLSLLNHKLFYRVEIFWELGFRCVSIRCGDGVESQGFWMVSWRLLSTECNRCILRSVVMAWGSSLLLEWLQLYFRFLCWKFEDPAKEQLIVNVASLLRNTYFDWGSVGLRRLPARSDLQSDTSSRWYGRRGCSKFWLPHGVLDWSVTLTLSVRKRIHVTLLPECCEARSRSTLFYHSQNQ